MGVQNCEVTNACRTQKVFFQCQSSNILYTFKISAIHALLHISPYTDSGSRWYRHCDISNGVFFSLNTTLINSNLGYASPTSAPSIRVTQVYLTCTKHLTEQPNICMVGLKIEIVVTSADINAKLIWSLRTPSFMSGYDLKRHNIVVGLGKYRIARH